MSIRSSGMRAFLMKEKRFKGGFACLTSWTLCWSISIVWPSAFSFSWSSCLLRGAHSSHPSFTMSFWVRVFASMSCIAPFLFRLLCLHSISHENEACWLLGASSTYCLSLSSGLRKNSNMYSVCAHTLWHTYTKIFIHIVHMRAFIPSASQITFHLSWLSPLSPLSQVKTLGLPCCSESRQRFLWTRRHGFSCMHPSPAPPKVWLRTLSMTDPSHVIKQHVGSTKI